jgi:type IV secretory pathway ATPase VirB11/archaellum biosynthesis ATPase
MPDNPLPATFYKDSLNQRAYSLDSLRERVEERFAEETSGRPDILAELDSRAKRLQAVREVADYLLASEYITLPEEAKRQVINRAVDNLFYFGPLDPYLRDPLTSEVNLEGHQTLSVAQVGQPAQRMESPFYDSGEVERLLERLLAPTSARLTLDNPFIEVGSAVHDRPVRISAAGPPVNPMVSLQLRLHRPQPFHLEDFVPAIIPTAAATHLQAAIQAGQGVLITGEVGTGKTALLAALLNHLASWEGLALVERAREIRLEGSPGRWADSDFGVALPSALAASPRLLALDEVRGDEGAALWQALTSPSPQQLLMVFRGTSQTKRLVSALSMVLRKQSQALESSAIYEALLQKLPLVLALGHDPGLSAARLVLLGRWVVQGDDLALEIVSG